MPKRGRPRNFNRAIALQQAMMAFWEKGYDNTSMSDLIAAMDINSPSIYAAFGCKEKLFREAVALYRATEGKIIWDSMTAAPSARNAIETMLHSSAKEFTQPNKPRGCLIILGALYREGENNAICRELQKHRAQCVSMLHQRFKKSVAEGELPNGQNWQAIATFYITVQQGMSIQARDGASYKTLITVADYALAAWDKLCVVNC